MPKSEKWMLTGSPTTPLTGPWSATERGEID
jgi:hypothetical protein